LSNMGRAMKDDLVTIFGGGGFLGRHVAQALMAHGARVRIAQRNLAALNRLKPLAGLGQAQFVAADVTNAKSVARAVVGSTIVINLVGILSGDFDGVHHRGAENVAKAAAAIGARALVHVSAIGADAQSPSAYGRSKAAGEAAVKAAFPAATIIRPSIVFGAEDQFINRFAEIIRLAPVVPVIGADTKFQPVFVRDVAHAIANAANDPLRFGAKTFELGGPQVISMMDLNHFIGRAIGRDRTMIAVPEGMARIIAMLPGAPITRDQLAMLSRDNVVAPGTEGLNALDVQPTPLAAVADSWLVRYRRSGRFAGRAQAG